MGGSTVIVLKRLAVFKSFKTFNRVAPFKALLDQGRRNRSNSSSPSIRSLRPTQDERNFLIGVRSRVQKFKSSRTESGGLGSKDEGERTGAIRFKSSLRRAQGLSLSKAGRVLDFRLGGKKRVHLQASNLKSKI